MQPQEFIHIMNIFEALKCNTRHSWLSNGRRESVAEHSWRLSMMAYFIKDEFPQADINKLIQMTIFHDIGEAFTGDIPCFEKTQQHEETEDKAVAAFLDSLPDSYKVELKALFAEMNAMETLEAKIYKALDRMEAVIQHNEADISTWLPLEYDLQMNYGEENVGFSPYLKELREEIKRISQEKKDGK